MAMQSTLSCWEITQCNKQYQCSHGGEKKIACWEKVKEDDACSFHICTDCLVYLANQDNTSLSEKEFCSILEKRRANKISTFECRLVKSLRESWYPDERLI